MFFRTPIALALAALTSSTTAMPTSDQNWETTTNELGYSTRRFKSGFEPGSEDFYHRFGDKVNATLSARDTAKRTTVPYVGKTRIPYGCNTDIGNYVFSKIHDICGDNQCDGGSSISAEVEYPESGYKKKATVSAKVEAHYPTGYKDALIRAIQAMVPQNGVDYYQVTSWGPQSSHVVQRVATCEVVGASNFYSVVITDDNDGDVVGKMDVLVSFEMGEEGAICGTVATVAKEIAGAINGFAGALFGIVQAVSCKG